MAGCETTPTRAFIESLGSPEHRPPPDLMKLVLQDKTDSAETIQSASWSRHYVNACPPKYAVFHFHSTVSKSSHKSTSAFRQTCRSWLCCKVMNLHIVLAAEDKKGPIAKGATYRRVMQLTGGNNMATCRCYQMLTSSISLRPFPSTLWKLLTVLKHGANFPC